MSPPSPWSIIALAAAPRHEERALGHHVVLQVPVGLGRFQQWLGDRQPCIVDDEVDAAESECRRVDGRLHRAGVRNVGCDSDRCVSRPDALRDGRRGRAIEVGDDHAGALGTEPLGDGLADAGSATSHQRNAAGERLGLRHPPQLGFLERPVLDAKLLALLDGRVRGQRLGTAHHVDRVDVELAGDPRSLLVLAEGEHPHAGDENDGRIGTAHRGAVGGGVPVVIGRVVLAVFGVQLAQPGDDLV